MRKSITKGRAYLYNQCPKKWVPCNEVFTNPHKILKEMPNLKWEPCFAYHLSRGFKPENEVKTGKIYANGRVWVMLDTLFICKTIAQARDLSQKRDNDI